MMEPAANLAASAAANAMNVAVDPDCTLTAATACAPSAAGAAPLAAALQEKAKLRGKRVGLILSGGNIDFDLFKRWVVGEAVSGGRVLV